MNKNDWVDMGEGLEEVNRTACLKGWETGGSIWGVLRFTMG